MAKRPDARIRRCVICAVSQLSSLPKRTIAQSPNLSAIGIDGRFRGILDSALRSALHYEGFTVIGKKPISGNTVNAVANSVARRTQPNLRSAATLSATGAYPLSAIQLDVRICMGKTRFGLRPDQIGLDDPLAKFRFNQRDARGLAGVLRNYYLREKRLRLALQLLYRKASESMGNHDSEIVDAGSVD